MNKIYQIMIPLIFLACSGETKLKTFNGNSFAISYPEGWETSKVNGAYVFKAPKSDDEEEGKSTFRPNINLFIESLTEPTSVAEYEEFTVSQIENMLGDKSIMRREDFNIQDDLGKLLVYKMADANNTKQGNIVVKQLYCVRSKKAYVITLSVLERDFEKYDKSLNKVFTSFRIN